MLSSGTAPGHTLPPIPLFYVLSLSLFLLSLPSSLSHEFKFQLIDKEKTQMLVLLLREFVAGQYLSVYSDESGTGGPSSPSSLSARLSRGEALVKSVPEGI